MSSLLEMGRSHHCGELRANHVGQTVVLFGWVNYRRDHGGRVFIDLRDREGMTQINFGPDIDATAHETAQRLRSEYCIAVQGKVVSRGTNTNPNLATGAIEVEIENLEIFSESATPPFSISEDERLDTHENTRLRHRYLDLRRPSLQKNFLVRSKIGTITRQSLTRHGFLELETPYLVKYTPGGARNFIVPSRLSPGTFYALAESPQIYKQLFMVSGLDRYFQITRCYRDEDLRFDRQPEFTQIDVEMSFATPQRVFAPIEELMANLWRDILNIELPRPFPKMTWTEAMNRFGSDKPDTRFGLELHDCTDLTRDCGFRVFAASPLVKGLCVEAKYAAELTRGRIDKLTEFVKKRENGGAQGLAWARIQEDGSWQAPFAKMLNAETMQSIQTRMGAQPGSILLFIADNFDKTHMCLNALRLELRDSLKLVPEDAKWRFLWVTEFPQFERNEKGNWVSSHHPFTMPKLEDIEHLEQDPGRVKAQAYDLVLNGNEIGGGSIRIHRGDVQEKVFATLGLDREAQESKFGFLLEAFKYGPPPHGGIALGLDRLSMLMCGTNSIRDVIAFPKTQKGQDLMTSCPTPVDDAQLQELYLRHRALPNQDGAGES